MQKIDQTISDITDQCSDTLVYQRALLMGEAAFQNIDLQKYREIVLKEMDKKKTRRVSETPVTRQVPAAESSLSRPIPAAEFNMEDKEPQTGF